MKHGKQPSEKAWSRKAPYDFTGCLAHLDITLSLNDHIIQRITGITNHNLACQDEIMKRLPAIPLHPYIWQIALEQLNAGAS